MGGPRARLDVCGEGQKIFYFTGIRNRNVRILSCWLGKPRNSWNALGQSFFKLPCRGSTGLAAAPDLVFIFSSFTPTRCLTATMFIPHCHSASSFFFLSSSFLFFFFFLLPICGPWSHCCRSFRTLRWYEVRMSAPHSSNFSAPLFFPTVS